MNNILGLDPLPDRQSWEKSLGEFLEIVVRSNPDKIFVEIAGQQITYADFYRRCRSAATMFRDLGIGQDFCLFTHIGRLRPGEISASLVIATHQYSTAPGMS